MQSAKVIVGTLRLGSRSRCRRCLTSVGIVCVVRVVSLKRLGSGSRRSSVAFLSGEVPLLSSRNILVVLSASGEGSAER